MKCFHKRKRKSQFIRLNMQSHVNAYCVYVVLFLVSQYAVWRTAHSFSHRHGEDEERGRMMERDVSMALSKFIL